MSLFGTYMIGAYIYILYTVLPINIQSKPFTHVDETREIHG